jgi:hypothetical protein
MNGEDHIHILNARFLNEAMSTFSKYCEKVPLKEMNAALNFDWSSMLPESVRSSKYNPFESKGSRKIYTLLLKKKHSELMLRFAYNRFYKNYRNMKSRLLNK